MTELTEHELRDVQLSILDRIGAFCRENDIAYHLGFGTLLGAVRYGGYIPWDDDIDLMMPRADYDRFCRTFQGTDPDLTLGAPGLASDWAYPYAKVSDARTVLIEDTALEHDLGVNIDIFPLDHCASTPLGRRRQWATVNTLKRLLLLKSLTPRPGRAQGKERLLRIAKPLVRLLPQGWLVRRIDRVAAEHAGKSSRVSVLVGPYVWEVAADAVASSTALEFEDRRAPAPAGHHDVLSALYGPNYIEPPPEHKRVTQHRFTAYWA